MTKKPSRKKDNKTSNNPQIVLVPKLTDPEKQKMRIELTASSGEKAVFRGLTEADVDAIQRLTEPGSKGSVEFKDGRIVRIVAPPKPPKPIAKRNDGEFMVAKSRPSFNLYLLERPVPVDNFQI